MTAGSVHLTHPNRPHRRPPGRWWSCWPSCWRTSPVVEVLYVTAGPGKNALLSVGRFFGLHVALVMMVPAGPASPGCRGSTAGSGWTG